MMKAYIFMMKMKTMINLINAIQKKINFLISILIIGLAVIIFNRASATVNRADLNSQEAQAQNGQFTGYFGDKVSASDVKALISLIRSNNITSQTAEETKAIGIKFQGATGSAGMLAPSAASKKIIAGKTYTVGTDNDTANQEDEDPTPATGVKDQESAYYKSGFLRIISITENTATGGASGPTTT